MQSGSITLADVAIHTDKLVVACSLYDRSGRYPVTTLIGRHGAYFPIPALLRELSANCPIRLAARIHEPACTAPSCRDSFCRLPPPFRQLLLEHDQIPGLVRVLTFQGF
jgi:hypothetical protein